MSATPSTPGPRPPLLGERYVIADRVGRGSAADVFLAFDLQLQRWRAAKVMHPSAAAKPEMRARFDLEATTIARIDHPNVVRVLDVQMGALPYMVMELAEAGCVLEGMRTHGALAPAQAVRVTCDVLRALEAIHAQGVVHRDVKPHNVLVDRFGRAKLTDFGIAKQRDRAEQRGPVGLTQAGTAMGTRAFMPPEQQHDASSVGPVADVYATGATLFALLTSALPRDLYVADVADQQLQGVPEPLRPVLLTACAYQPEARYPTAGAFLQALEGAGRALGPPPSGPLFDDAVPPPAAPPEALGPEAVEAVAPLVVSGAVVHAWAGAEAEGLDGPPAVPIDRAAYGGEAPAPPEPAPEPAAPKAPPEPAPEPEPMLDPATIRRLIVGGAVGLVLLLALGGLVGVMETARGGAMAVIDARAAERQAERRLEDLLAQQAPLVQAMAAAGADGERLRQAFFAFRDAPVDGRQAQAQAFVEALREEHARLPRSDDATDRAWRALATQLAAVEAREAETAAAEASAGAQLAGALGLF